MDEPPPFAEQTKSDHPTSSLHYYYIQTVWPKKIAKCLKKLPKNDFARKMINYDNFTKIA